MQNLLPIILSYLLGSITFSFVVGKLILGIDVRQHGSGNAGATNTLRVLGKVPGVLVLLLDIFKGVVAVWFGSWLMPEQSWVASACGLAVILGHNWPIYFGFKGGKGIATTIGVMAAISFWPTLLASVLAVLTIFCTRYVSLGSLILTASLPFILWLFDATLDIIVLSILIWILACWRHRPNIIKLIQGKESKIGRKL